MEELRIRQGATGGLTVTGADGRMESLKFSLEGKVLTDPEDVPGTAWVELDRSNVALLYRFIERWLGSV